MKNILVKLPTRSRPEQCYETLKGWVKKQRGPKVKYIVTYDTDDETMTEEVIQRLALLRNASPDNVIPMAGQSKSKIDACNRDIKKYTEYFPEWDIIILVSDDMICQMDNWDNIVRQKFEEHFPDTDGCLWFHDGSKQKVISTLSVIGRKYYDRFGYIYNPEYKSFFCDNEYTEIAKRHKKIVFIDQVLANHEHPHWRGGHGDDALYQANAKHWDHDKELYYRREALGFPQV